ncbi:winged helix-turn-helix domain-containing protein [Ktedonobacter racemifer]|uniref:winged helix-turn-helix domain-containing protein n=1 Tax=Ktedonobacter racemifer TaxID=363277 RepID=UPI001FCB124D|nr:winged helix-turn-helix domain-containing protein [Ktedonobacter racemifer]
MPFLNIVGPDGRQFQMDLEKDTVTIGRFDQFNDIALSPDPQQLITRKVHCTLEHGLYGWWIVDNGSVNRTFVLCGNDVQVVQGRTLSEGESIRILGKLSETGKPGYWELTFSDPLGTRPSGPPLQVAYLEYDWIQARLYRIEGPRRQEIRELRPQEHKLIRYMEQRNWANGNVPVMCSYEELLAAVWGEEAYHTEGDDNHLIWELRKKLEPDPKAPRFLETVRGLGYRLITAPRAKEEA